MGAGSGTGDNGRIPEMPGLGAGAEAAVAFLVMAISWRWVEREEVELVSVELGEVIRFVGTC